MMVGINDFRYELCKECFEQPATVQNNKIYSHKLLQDKKEYDIVVFYDKNCKELRKYKIVHDADYMLKLKQVLVYFSYQKKIARVKYNNCIYTKDMFYTALKFKMEKENNGL